MNISLKIQNVNIFLSELDKLIKTKILLKKVIMQQIVKFTVHEKEKLVTFAIPRQITKNKIDIRLESNLNVNVKIGARNKATIFIHQQQQQQQNSIILINNNEPENEQIIVFKLKKTSWIDQFKNAINVNQGDSIENATCTDHILHSIAFYWKCLFSILIPPSLILKGWPCFIISLIMTCLLANLIVNLIQVFDCITNLSSSFLPQK